MIEQMEPGDKKVLTNVIFGASWIPEITDTNLLALAERTFGKGDYELCRQIGYYNAKHNTYNKSKQ